MSKYQEPHMNVRIYFTVPYNDKEDFKLLGGRWDPERKMWYVVDSDKAKGTIFRCQERWSEPEPFKIIDGVKIPFGLHQ